MIEAAPPAAYFVALGEDRYEPTDHAGGAWRDDELHLAPVAGLLVHHLERWRQANAGALCFSRFAFEVLGQIPRSTVEISTEVVRPGRTIELIEATAMMGGRATIRVRAWLLQRSDTAGVAGDEFDPMPSPEECEDASTLLDWPGGFIRSVRALQAPDRRPGRARAWVSSELPLVAGEPAQPLAEFLKLIDTANGIAVRQPPEEWMFPNVDLTVHLYREPSGVWAGLDTRVAFGPAGIGVTASVLHDAAGPVGAIQQSLTLRRIPQR